MSSFDAVPTTLAQLAKVAADRGVLLGHDPGHSILVLAHHANWRIHPHPGDLNGWCATRVDAVHRDIPEVVGWLGPRDIDADRVVDNLLAEPRLPTNVLGQDTWISTQHPWADAPAYLYARCPQPRPGAAPDATGCGLTGPAQLVNRTTPDRELIDLTSACLVRCRICRAVFDGRLQAVPPTTTSRCPRCPALFPVPDEATHLCCHDCGFRFFARGIPTAYLTKLQRLMATDEDDNVVRAMFGRTNPPVRSTL